MIQVKSVRMRAGGCPRFLTLTGLLAGLLATQSFAGTNTFTSVGLHGGSVNKVAYHPTNSAIVFAAANSGFYRSTDGGLSWQVVNDQIIGAPLDIAVTASQPDRVFVVSPANGVLSSEDAGATLTKLSTFPPSFFNGTDVEYSADGSMLYVCDGQSVHRSSDHGASWQQGELVSANPTLITRMVVDPTEASVLYVAAGNGEGFQSADSGQTWQPWNLPNGALFQLAIANTQPLRFWVANATGTWYSDDRGLNWTNSLSPLGSQMVAIDPDDANIVYTGTYQGLQRTTDNGANWTNIQGSAATGAMIYSLAIDPANSARWLFSGVSGIAGSADGGATWNSRHDGIDALSSYELVTSPASDRIYLNTVYDGVYAISGADQIGSPLNNIQLRQLGNHLTIYGRGLFVHPGTPDRLLTGVLTGIARSFNEGASWSLLSHPAFPGQVTGIVAGSADAMKLFAVTPAALYSTVNGGNNWAQVGSLTATELGVAASAPSNPQVIYVTGRPTPSSSVAVMRSTDGGLTWTTHAFPRPFVLSIAVDPRDEQMLYAGSGEGLLKSSDGGETWNALSVYPGAGHPSWAVTIDPRNPDIVYTGGSSRIARSVDAGQTWQKLTSDQAPFWDIRALAVDSLRPHSLYAGINGRGVKQFSIEPDLELSATVPGAPVPYGVPATYSYQVRNIGPFDATNVRTRVQLPATATHVTATSPGATCSVAGAVATCISPIVRVAATADITVTSIYSASTDFAIVSSVAGDQPDVAPANNTITSTIQVTELTDLSVALTAPARVTTGTPITFTLTVTNAGPNAATAPTVYFELASGLSIATFTPPAGTACLRSDSSGSCQLPSLAPGASITITIVTAATTTAGPFSMTANIVASRTDLVASNNAASGVTTVSNPSPPSQGGGGGGSSSVLMLGVLLLLSQMRKNCRPRCL